MEKKIDKDSGAFELDHRLQSDCALVGDFMLCRVLLMKDANYPWIVLVPKREQVSEIYQLDTDDQEQLIWESSFVAQGLAKEFAADKMNVAALGNVVKQLHIHHVVRKHTDPAWPDPVWGRVAPRGYTSAQLKDRILRLHKAFQTSTFKPAEV